MDIGEFREKVFAAGTRSGLGEMEIYVSRSENFRVRVFQKEIDDYSLSVEQGVGFRADYRGKVGYAYVETLDEESVNVLVEGAKANAQIIDSDDEIQFFAGSPAYPDVSTYDETLNRVSPQEKIEFTKALEAEAFAADPRVSMVNWAMTGSAQSEVHIANTKGLDQHFIRNGAYSFVSAVAREKDAVKTAARFFVDHDWRRFDAKKLAQEAVHEATSLLGATSLESGNYRALLRHDVANDLLATFSSVFSAEAVQKGLSLLGGKMGQQIASPLVNITDDPLLSNMGASRPFDGEGVAARTKKVVEQGQLTTFLHNLKTAKKDGIASTGNASRASFKSPVGISPTNFFIESGGTEYVDLVKKLGDGIIIIDVQGLHSGANPVSGDFSLGAYGYLVEKGQIVRAVEQITVAGNFFRLLESVEEIGADLEFGSLGQGGHFGSPSLLIRELSIAGM